VRTQGLPAILAFPLASVRKVGHAPEEGTLRRLPPQEIRSRPQGSPPRDFP
jgi:hypothetical protein